MEKILGFCLNDSKRCEIFKKNEKHIKKPKIAKIKGIIVILFTNVFMDILFAG